MKILCQHCEFEAASIEELFQHVDREHPRELTKRKRQPRPQPAPDPTNRDPNPLTR